MLFIRERRLSLGVTSSMSLRESSRKYAEIYNAHPPFMLTQSHQLRAFEKLLCDYPEWQGNVVLIQVTSPALSGSPKLERQVSELVSHINGEYGSLDFIPVHH